jgi:uncharacterized protein (DUF1800 family)
LKEINEKGRRKRRNVEENYARNIPYLRVSVEEKFIS